jgi:hypothetical protein
MPRLAAGLALAALMLAACGGDSNDDDGGGGGGGGGGSGPFTAVVDGEAWAADDITIAAQTVPSVPGGFVITGSRVRSATDVASIGLSLYNVTGAGTYPLGVLPSVFGGIGTYGEATGAWVTPFTGASGTVTLTTLTATRIVGTFAFTATDNTGGPSRAITSGRFDLPLSSGGALPTVPPNAGSRITGTVGGEAYAAHTVAVTQSGPAGLSVTSLNDRYSVTLVLDGVTAAGTYPISLTPPLRLLAVNATTGPAPRGSWGTANGTTGSVTITSLTAARARGTFTGTLAPQGGTGAPLAVTGEFDVGLP